MKPFSELTERGQYRRLRALTLRALESYDLIPKQVRFLVGETNTMFRVDGQDGERYVMRVYSPEDTTYDDNKVEMYWLKCIVRDTDIRVTEPVARKDGKVINCISTQGVPGKRRCVLFRWVPGRPLEEQISPESYRQCGAIMAQLHAHAATLTLPKTLKPKRWDKVFYYPDEPVVYNKDEYQHHFPKEHRATMDAVVRKADRFLNDLYLVEHGRRLIHGDMHYWNIHLHRGDLYIIDFEDVTLGYPLQDIATSLYYVNDHPQYQVLREAFRAGYSSVRPWPIEDQQQLEILWAARKAMFINYVARIWPDPSDFIERGCRKLQDYLEMYGD